MSSDIAAGVIHRLKEVMAELEADKKRMDWLENNWALLPEIRAYCRAKTRPGLRAAIDHAIEMKAISDEWEARDYRARMEGMSRG